MSTQYSPLGTSKFIYYDTFQSNIKKINKIAIELGTLLHLYITHLQAVPRKLMSYVIFTKGFHC